MVTAVFYLPKKFTTEFTERTEKSFVVDEKFFLSVLRLPSVVKTLHR
jgi:hypothetical protein